MRAVPIVFEPGQLVWLLVPAIPVGTSAKFARLWRGPFRVIEKLSDVVYRVEDTRQAGRIQVVHVNRLKKCFSRPEHLLAIREEVEDTSTNPSTSSDARNAHRYVPDATDLLYGPDERDDLEQLALVPVDSPARPTRNAGIPVRLRNDFVLF